MTTMGKGRLEAFSDGVLAIIITIMVLELKAPHTGDISGLYDLLPVFLSYCLSFVYVGIYWNNHHHLFQAAREVNGKILWANLHLLFWLSLIPFSTAWLGENHGSAAPTALYGGVLLMAAIAFLVLQTCITRNEGRASPLSLALGQNGRGKLSIVFYGGGIACAFITPVLAWLCYIAVALMWLVPDRRIEKTLQRNND